MKRRALTAITLALALTQAGCGQITSQGSNTTSATTPSAAPTATSAENPTSTGELFPDVLDAELTPTDGKFTVSVTLSSPYDSPERYADGWRVLAPDGSVLAEHTLTHDHANEQPFTRTSQPFTIPATISSVIVEGRDQESGYGGATVTVTVPR